MGQKQTGGFYHESSEQGYAGQGACYLRKTARVLATGVAELPPLHNPAAANGDHANAGRPKVDNLNTNTTRHRIVWNRRFRGKAPNNGVPGTRPVRRFCPPPHGRWKPRPQSLHHVATRAW
ncbi:hypothetical protein GCM10012275_44200 [Longimycelium tulufanense]|uniref:Uncharacterized protein n=1 Tax=Longimycelium tulufanense TaxID=907463 RepID=A0A8J3CHN1_9PSEU|nr:hypothetical protein GCM10012275_44200 [Longimycelium tulufanense]